MQFDGETEDFVTKSMMDFCLLETVIIPFCEAMSAFVNISRSDENLQDGNRRRADASYSVSEIPLTHGLFIFVLLSSHQNSQFLLIFITFLRTFSTYILLRTKILILSYQLILSPYLISLLLYLIFRTSSVSALSRQELGLG